MPLHDDSIYLGHMLDTARRVRHRLLNVSKAEFDTDEDLQLAMTRQLRIIGEAAWSVSESTQRAIPGIPWARMSGMRHRLVHDYMSVDFDIVWLTAKTRMDEIVEAIEKYLGLDEPTPSA